MRKIILAATLGLAVFLAGCIPSLNPLYTEKDLVFDPALVGVWSNGANATDSWKFQKRDEKSYALVIRDDDKTSPFVAHLVKLGKYRFLDLCPNKDGLNDSKVEGTYAMALIRGHLFLKVSQIEPTLQMVMLDPDWLDKLLKKNPKSIHHKRNEDGDGIVLTASTKELQKFMLKYADTKDAFGKPDEPGLQKVASPPKSGTN